VLFIRGELSDYVPDEDLDKINKLYPQVEIETILGSGHWIHAEKPEAFILVVKRFLGLIE
jgi:esterase